MSRRLPNLQNVILRSARDRPWGVWAPGNIAHFAGMTTVNKQKLGRPVFGIVGSLFSTNSIEVPYVDAAIGGGRCEVDRRCRGPGKLKNIVCMSFERVVFGGKLSKIPKSNGLYVSVSMCEVKRNFKSELERTLSDEPVKNKCSLLGAKEMQLISALWPWTWELALAALSLRVSQLRGVSLDNF